MTTTKPGNLPEFSVSELSGAIKRTVEDAFGYVRVRGELGRVVRSGNGHCYLDLKDDRAVIASVIWKGTFGRLSIKPEQGMEVVATGRLSTFAGQSKYQLIVDTLEPAGAGALMALLEARKKQLAAEGLFDDARKKPLPYLPGVIGVVTSPSGAVIRDILHRLRDRFPSRVLVWPTMVQGERAVPQIVAGIEGFSTLPLAGPVPRPDVMIVARGGGSLEDLWCFNDEAVVRAVAASPIPVISAVGHETDTTLIDYVADRRAPTPTAAAEMAVPVRLDLMADIAARGSRLSAAIARLAEERRLSLHAAERGLGRPEGLLAPAEQRFDRAASALTTALKGSRDRSAAAMDKTAARFSARLVAHRADRSSDRLQALSARLARAPAGAIEAASAKLAAKPLPRGQVRDRFRRGGNDLARNTRRLVQLGGRLLDAPSRQLDERSRLLGSLSYRGVLERGFVLARDGEGRVIRRAEEAASGMALTLAFIDGERGAVVGEGGTLPPATAKPRKSASKKAPTKKAATTTPPASQGGLFED